MDSKIFISIIVPVGVFFFLFDILICLSGGI